MIIEITLPGQCFLSYFREANINFLKKIPRSCG
jgi:hypothetical protein